MVAQLLALLLGAASHRANTPPPCFLNPCIRNFADDDYCAPIFWNTDRLRSQQRASQLLERSLIRVRNWIIPGWSSDNDNNRYQLIVLTAGLLLSSRKGKEQLHLQISDRLNPPIHPTFSCKKWNGGCGFILASATEKVQDRCCACYPSN